MYCNGEGLSAFGPHDTDACPANPTHRDRPALARGVLRYRTRTPWRLRLGHRVGGAEPDARKCLEISPTRSHDYVFLLTKSARYRQGNADSRSMNR